MRAADTYFRTVSRGRIGHQTTVLGWQKIPRPAARCGIMSQMAHLAEHGSARARRAGHNPAKFDRIIFYVTHEACGQDSYGVAGIGSYPGRFVWLEGTLAPNIVIHELGHNLGLGHANYEFCTARNGTRTILGPPRRCGTREYADASDVMGNHPDAGWFSAPKLARLGWFSGKNLVVHPAAKKKTYTLRPAAASTTKLKVVRVKGTQGRFYWVEYRRRTGLDANIAPGLAGVQIRLGRPGTQGGESSVLDMLPDAAADWFDIQSVALPARASWTSPEGIRFTVGKTGTTAKVTIQRKARKARKPLAPAPQVSAADLGAKLRWPYPKDRGTPVQSYTLRLRSSDGRTQTTTVSQLDGPIRSTLLSDLDPTLRYAIAVRAHNHRGRSPWSRSVTVRPLNLAPTITIASPAAGTVVRGSVRAEVVPQLPRGSASELASVDVCLVDPSDGFDHYLNCDGISGWSTTIKPGKPVTLTVPAPYVGQFVLRADVVDSHGRSGSAQIPVTVAP